jgi:hypothetical protein
MSNILVPPNANLSAILATAVAGATYDLTTAATYVVTAPINLKASITINGNCATIRKTANPTAPAASTIVTEGGNITLNNIHFDSDKPLATSGPAKVNYYGITARGAGLTVNGCTFANVDDGIHSGGSNSNTVVNNCLFDSSIRGVNIWVAGLNTTIRNSVFLGSQQEHNIRMDDAGASGLVIDNCQLTNTVSGKETLTMRNSKAPSGIKVTNCSFAGGWVRLGIVAKTTPIPDNCLNGVEISGCTFNPGTWLELDQSVRELLFANNTFLSNAVDVPVHVWGPNITAHLTNNTRVMQPGQTRVKPFARINNTSPSDVIAETGTVEKPH